MILFTFNWVSISFKHLLKIFNFFSFNFSTYTELQHFLIRIEPKNRCQELKSGGFVNSIGFLHEKSPDAFVCRQAKKVLIRRGWCTYSIQPCIFQRSMLRLPRLSIPSKMNQMTFGPVLSSQCLGFWCGYFCKIIVLLPKL